MLAGLIHDYLLAPRGAERTFESIASCWPGATIYTSVIDRDAMGQRFAAHQAVTSGLQRLRVNSGSFRHLLPLYPGAFERLPVDGHDLLVSSSSAFAHGVRPADGAVHVCYCHSPLRYVWHERDRAMAEAPRGMGGAMGKVLDRVRAWDVQASNRVTHYIANSEITRQRIADFYERDATVIHPPVDTERFAEVDDREPEDYLLYVGEVTAHKRVEVAIDAAVRAERPLKIVGDGPERPRLEAQHDGKHKNKIEFVGRVPDDELNELFARATALIVPNVEEFGIAAVEAQAAGRPVVAIDRGGTSETVVDGETGVLVENGTVDEFAEALRETDFSNFPAGRARANAERFSARRFRREFREFVGEAAVGAACAS